MAAQLFGTQPKGIDDLDTAWPVGQVAAIAVIAVQEVVLCVAALTPALSQREREHGSIHFGCRWQQGCDFGGGHDETSPMQFAPR